MADIFIVGSPRSGTTWLRTLLAGHPELASPHELHLFSHYLAPIERAWADERAIFERRRASGLDGAAGLVSLLERADLESWMRDLYARTRGAALRLKPGATRMLEKTPGHARHVELIRRIVPDARFVHIVRDPRDVVASMIEKSRRPFGAWAPREVKRATKSWRNHVRDALRDARPEDTLRVHYEDLRTDLHGTLARLADFLALEGRVDTWLVGDPSSPAHERTRELTVERPHAATEAPRLDDPRSARLREELGAPTTRRLSRTASWYVESRCAEEMATLGYAPRLFTPGRSQPLWSMAAAVDLRARRAAQRLGRRRRPSARRGDRRS